MKLGCTSRREFIPRSGNKHLLHHADPAVRHTHVYGPKGRSQDNDLAGRQEGRTISVRIAMPTVVITTYTLHLLEHRP